MMDSKTAPLIFEIKGNALDDGPGIRTVVFFKGCPLSCVWCHNPESKRREPQIAFDAKKCVICDSCIDVCPLSAIDRNHPFFVDRERCDLCGQCIDVCPSGALSIVGQEMSIEQIVSAIEKDIPFFNNSGGGVTLSGGEPTLFMDFAARLARALQQRGVRVLLETCGLFHFDSFFEQLYPHLDTIYFDIKIIDSQRHRVVCGASNQTILDNFRRLFRLYKAGGIPVLPRVPLIPNLTTDEENLRAIAAFLKEQSALEIALLQNNPFWFDKCHTIGSEPPIPSSVVRARIGREKMNAIRKLFDGFTIL
jgi:pyruvate formate lyase activating enzyme